MCKMLITVLKRLNLRIEMIDNKRSNPLVSVPVITYNSAKTVIDTLDSIKAQTYPNIELIISDDCSKDDTVAVCRKWLEQNKERFARTELLTVEKNTGVAGNCNRAIIACQGEWVKGIAGDDILMPDCIESYMDYVNSHPDAAFLFGKLSAFGEDEAFVKDKEKGFEYTFFSLTPEQQLDKLMIDGNVLPAPAFFYNRKKYIELRQDNDTRIPLIEDWAMWINMLKKGAHFDFIDKVLVAYRIGGISTQPYMSKSYFSSLRKMWFLYQYPYWVEKYGEEAALNETIRQEYAFYNSYAECEKKYLQVNGSYAYKLGKRIIAPFAKMKSIINKILK